MAGYIGKSQGVTQVDGYTRSELDGGQLDTRYYTESEVDSLLSGIASDAITEGNSSVEVVDTGTGYVAVTVDGSETARFDASGNLGVGTTSDGSIGHFKNATGNATLKVEGGTTAGNDAYTNIEIGNTTGTSAVYFSDTTNGVGRITYEHNGDYMRMYTASTERMRIDSSGNLRFNSGYGSVETAYGIRVWATIQQSPSNATKGSGGLGSYTDIGVGRIQLNLLNAMPDLNYTVLATSGWLNSDPQSAGTAVYRVSSTYCRVETYDTSSEGNVDFGHTSIVLVR